MEQITDVHVPQIMEEIVEVAKVVQQSEGPTTHSGKISSMSLCRSSWMRVSRW